MSHKVEQITQALLEIEKLRGVERQTYTVQGERRRENSAEHSWHLAMACWVIAEQFDIAVNMTKLLQMALLHDLGEIDGGDTFLYSASRAQAADKEASCITRLASEFPALPCELDALWREQEEGSSREAKLLKVADRLLPFLLNLQHQGYPWREHGITAAQVKSVLAFIEADFPDIHDWMMREISRALALGWLRED
ncbi:HD domain-containing protein [Gilvimarinus sp. SDUM040013]|uniref:5'-deoxynucleotidase n=1 Tax=Gilvimarinus gilvus TaxID=3058038 RepID=A0ABU4RVL8_9GAMM|nr:HD domain-containing protein [Gilvimarinus sp. SDUM040013]MDO3386754.1 HD domain-containing protein [Gilvimarinus sp. SDUM040013]MDX6848316.1 HD domain-containing protein [Gilvimarinus sp. SDUM040013]